MEQLKETDSKTLADGQSMHLMFCTPTIWFFQMDFDLIYESIDKQNNLLGNDGDCDMNGRLKVHESLYCISILNLKKAAIFFLKRSLDIVSLKEKVADALDVLSIMVRIPCFSDFLNSVCDYHHKLLFVSFAGSFEHIVASRRYLYPRIWYFLQSYRNLTTDPMPKAFGVVNFVDLELSPFTVAKKLHYKVHKVAVVLEIAANMVFLPAIAGNSAASQSVAFDDQIQMDQHVNELPEDILIGILSHLPAKILSKFKIVSASWYLMISDLCLPKLSAPSPSAKISRFIFITSSFLLRPLKFNDRGRLGGSSFVSDKRFLNSLSGSLPYDKQKPPMFEDCCNGMVLLAYSSASPVEYLVFNPATRECVRLPIYETRYGFELYHASLAFDPTISLNYRVVCFSINKIDDTIASPLVAGIFWSEIGKWSMHMVPLDFSVYGLGWTKRCIYLNGFLYWLSNAKYIICIDLKAVNAHERSLDSVMSAFPLPQQDKIDEKGFLGTSGRCLYYSNYVGWSMLFWVLDNGKDWVFKHSIDMIDFLARPLVVDMFAKHPFARNSLLRTFAIHHNSVEVYVGGCSFVFRYHLETKHLEVVFDAVNGDEVDEKVKNPVVEETEKVAPSPILQKSHSVQVIPQLSGVSSPLPSPLPSALPSDVTTSNLFGQLLFPSLQSVLQTNILQRDAILRLMKQMVIGDFSDIGCTPINLPMTEKSLARTCAGRAPKIQNRENGWMNKSQVTFMHISWGNLH
ncbi:26S proteasome non-ATPase regulatory subunit [Sesamum alatum]|uniref:26S proteasome non-ATPase regulatory subunit n=1 Tax=Sesamum alatum TaxID=300844 RepID=A0AAE1YDC9_9LAMI|nr:26S proteasome non-ATPase regulatory subunit [Sesamum alatum]